MPRRASITEPYALMNTSSYFRLRHSRFDEDVVEEPTFAVVPRGVSLLATCPVFGDHLTVERAIRKKTARSCLNERGDHPIC